MKRTILFSLIMLLTASFAVSQPAKKGVVTPVATVKQAKVEVYYFHFTRRCITCQAVETESKKAVETLYPEQIKKGLITFKSINLDEESSASLAKKNKVEGQSLLVIGKKKRIDITQDGFIYARSNPEKLKDKLKKTIDPLIK